MFGGFRQIQLPGGGLTDSEVNALIAAYATSPGFAASAITSGTFDNARVNWASPSALGSTTPAAIAGTTGIFGTSVSTPLVTLPFTGTAGVDLVPAGSNRLDIRREGGGTYATILLAILSTFNGVVASNSGLIGWASTATPSTTRDTALARNAAGVVEINNGTAGTLRDILLRSLTARQSDAVTNTATNVLTIGHNTSGTPAAGFGAGLLFALQSSTTADREAARVKALWGTATDASRVGNLVFSVWNVGTETDVLTLTPTAMLISVVPSSPGTGSSSERFGASSTAAGNSSAAFGASAKADVVSAVAIGASAQSIGTARGVAIGAAAVVNGDSGIAIGATASASGVNAFALGRGATSAFGGSMAFGFSATATAANQLVFGGDTGSVSRISDMYLGGVVLSSSNMHDVTFNAPGGSGVDVAGAALSISGGRGTGSGVGGSLIFRTAPAGSAGSSLNALVTRMTIPASGNVDIAGTVQADGLRLDVTPTAETPSMTHTITISVNGTNYKIPCVAA